MICTSVIPCLSSGLAKMSISVLFSRLFCHFESLPFFENGGGGGGGNLTSKEVRHYVFVNFLKTFC